jgi:hypothetical protein
MRDMGRQGRGTKFVKEVTPMKRRIATVAVFVVIVMTTSAIGYAIKPYSQIIGILVGWGLSFLGGWYVESILDWVFDKEE